MATLLLRLAGPLQSWGSSSYYDRRDSDEMPTKSGVIGILAAALGRKRGEPLDDLNKLHFGVRMDQPGRRMDDFQVTEMVSYGGQKFNPNISHRIYLADAKFLAGLEAEDIKILEDMEAALTNPCYPLFLGRRSCPPTVPLVLGIRMKNLYDALYDEEWLVPEWRRSELLRYRREMRLRIVTDADPSEGGTAIKKDKADSFSPFDRRYHYRSIKERPSKIIRSALPEHDPMKELG